MSELPDILIPDAFIGGEWCGADKRFAVTNPANGELLAEVPDLDADGARAAVAAAEAAGHGW
ncbi:aldehyde dehydrogenase family protein, partial [Halomonas sp. 3D7M]